VAEEKAHPELRRLERHLCTLERIVTFNGHEVIVVSPNEKKCRTESNHRQTTTMAIRGFSKPVTGSSEIDCLRRRRRESRRCFIMTSGEGLSYESCHLGNHWSDHGVCRSNQPKFDHHGASTEPSRLCPERLLVLHVIALQFI